jgi:23S rRNA (cytosine1962-C5)-methyltransferase
MDRITLITKPQAGYELVDSGGEEKLERFGEVVLARPDPQALWPKLSEAAWAGAAGTYVREGADKGKWVGKLPQDWQIEVGGLKMIVKPSSFKHTGVFPEHISGWEWVQSRLSRAPAKGRDIRNIPVARDKSKASFRLLASLGDEHDPNSLLQDSAQPLRVLNLFGYTGGYTLVAAKAGAEVTHVDASKAAVTWARENAELNGLAEAPVRWIVEDVLVYLRRELKRGSKYDAIIMDPPAFGHGPHDELWKFEEHFVELLKLCEQLLSEQPLFVLINGYAAGYSPLAFAYNLSAIQKKLGGRIEYGDLAIAESNSERVLPAGIFARWQA